eukprot:scaffold10181_cov120-Isochrysis_galbana.AAC.2
MHEIDRVHLHPTHAVSPCLHSKPAACFRSGHTSSSAILSALATCSRTCTRLDTASPSSSLPSLLASSPSPAPTLKAPPSPVHTPLSPAQSRGRPSPPPASPQLDPHGGGRDGVIAARRASIGSLRTHAAAAPAQQASRAVSQSCAS